MQAGREIAVHAVAQAALFTHLRGQPRREAAAAQNVVAHQQRKEVGIAALVAGLADEHVRLRRFKRDALVFRCRKRRHLGHGGQRRTGRALGQAAEQLRHDLVGLRARHRADQADLGAAGADQLGVARPHVADADARQRLGRGVVAVGMAAVHRFLVGQRGDGAGARARLLDGGRQALALALPHVVRPGRIAQLARGQLHRLLQQIGFGQRAQLKAHAVVARAAAKRGAQVGPGFAELVFVQRRLAVTRGHALAGDQRGDAGQARLIGRIAPAAGVEIHLHVEHRDRHAFDQVDLRAAGLRPVLDGDRGKGG